MELPGEVLLKPFLKLPDSCLASTPSSRTVGSSVIIEYVKGTVAPVEGRGAGNVRENLQDFERSLSFPLPPSDIHVGWVGAGFIFLGFLLQAAILSFPPSSSA